MSFMSTSPFPCSGGSLTSGKSRRRLSWYFFRTSFCLIVFSCCTLRGREVRVVSPLSHIFLRIFTGPCGLFFCWFGRFVVVFWWCVGLFSFWDGLVIILHSISSSSFRVSVVDRPCALARHCKKKKFLVAAQKHLSVQPCCRDCK